MHQASWNQKSIKMIPHICDKITTGKVTLKKIQDTWEVSLSAFWTRPTIGQMFIVGKTARKVMDIDAADGSYYASRKLSDVNWSDFIYSAKMIVIISDDIPVLTANIPHLANADIHSAMTIIRCRENQNITAPDITSQDKKETVKKEVEQLAHREQIHLAKKQQDVKSLLTLNPIERRKSPSHLKKASHSFDNDIAHTPTEWNIDKIESSLSENTVTSPFAGNFENAVFAKVEVAKAYGFDHMIISKVPVDNMHVYMLCIPGKAITPPYGLTDFNRWIPAVAGNGYWVKYILNN